MASSANSPQAASSDSSVSGIGSGARLAAKPAMSTMTASPVGTSHAQGERRADGDGTKRDGKADGARSSRGAAKSVATSAARGASAERVAYWLLDQASMTLAVSRFGTSALSMAYG